MAKKTVTLFHGDTPEVSLIRGHVTVAEFNKAFRAEGWEGDRLGKDNIQREYWRPMKRRGAWRKSTAEDKAAKKVTVTYW